MNTPHVQRRNYSTYSIDKRKHPFRSRILRLFLDRKRRGRQISGPRFDASVRLPTDQRRRSTRYRPEDRRDIRRGRLSNVDR